MDCTRDIVERYMFFNRETHELENLHMVDTPNGRVINSMFGRYTYMIDVGNVYGRDELQKVQRKYIFLKTKAVCVCSDFDFNRDVDIVRILSFRHGDSPWNFAISIEDSVLVNFLGYGLFVRKDCVEGVRE